MDQYSHMRSRVRRRPKARSIFRSEGTWNLACDYDYDYDYMGRCFMKKVIVGESITVHQHYFYLGYFQIAAMDMTRPQLPFLWYMHRDQTEPNPPKADRVYSAIGGAHYKQDCGI